MILDTENKVSTITGIGQAVIESEAFERQFKRGGDIHVTVSTKDISGVSAAMPVPVQVAGAAWSNALAVRGRLVPIGRTTGGAVSYLREGSTIDGEFTGTNLIVAEGALKPESDLDDWDQVTETVKTFAITFRISKQALEDVGYLAARIEQRYQAALLRRIDNEIIMGAGGATHLTGIYTLAPAAVSTGATTAAAIGAAYGELAGKGYFPDGLVVHTADLGKVLGGIGNTGAFNPVTGMLWGMRLAAVTDAGLSGKFLIGAFAGNSLYLEREEVGVDVALMDVDNFIKNMATVRIEGRGVLVDLEPTAFLRGTVGT